MSEHEILNRVYEAALEHNNSQDAVGVEHELIGHLQEIVDRTDKQKSVLAVTTTLLLKKIMDPGQDIRQHQANLPGGFSGRTLDTRVVTPFLRRNGFPYMGAGSGWLTRSLEQATPYTLDYPGGITPRQLKAAFLNVVDAIQRDGVKAEPALRHLLRLLIDRRDQDRTLKLARPINLTDVEIVRALGKHFDSGVQGSARLPVLAVHAIMSVLVDERGKYDGCSIAPLVTTLHGCQLIVNGVEPTVKYLLRIVSDTQRFIDAYVSHLESDPSISYDLKMKWNAAVGMGASM